MKDSKEKLHTMNKYLSVIKNKYFRFLL